MTPKPVHAWIMRDGTEIAVKDMNDRHLVSTIRMLRRNKPLRRAARGAYLAELGSACAYAGSAPDGAAMAVETEIASMDRRPLDHWRRKVLPVYGTLLDEASRRRLTNKTKENQE